MIYYTGRVNQTRKTAGAKAPTDILMLCNERGYIFFPLGNPIEKLPKLMQNMSKYIRAHLFWKKVLKTMQCEDVLIYQHPLYASRVLPRYIDKIKKKGIRLIVLVHDIELLRNGIEGAVKVNKSVTTMIEGQLLKQFDVVICHNQKMKQYLMSIGYQSDRLVCLELFDYLTSFSEVKVREKRKIPSVTVAGNLLKTKSGYVYHMHDNGHNANLKLHLYGLNFENENENKNMIYHGSVPSDILPEKLDGDFGLVWDGNSAVTCTGNTGEYLKYNNPHKTSLYLSAGMPVIVWNQAAIAEFVLKNKVGIAVNSLYELENRICNISENEYLLMCENAKNLSVKIRSGYYFYHALDVSLSLLGSD